MAQTKRKVATTTPAGFAIPLAGDTDLGLAVLVAEDEEGNYEPVSVVSTINEAREIGRSLLDRKLRLERGDDPGFCAAVLKLWARGVNGDYCVALTDTDPFLPD